MARKLQKWRRSGLGRQERKEGLGEKGGKTVIMM